MTGDRPGDAASCRVVIVATRLMKKKHLILLLKIVVSVGLLCFVFRKIAPDWRRVGVEMAWAVRRGYPWLVAAIATAGSVFAISAFRWKTLLHAHTVDIPFFRAFRLFLVGFFFGQFMPGGLAAGDIVRSYYISRCTLNRKTECIATVVIDRVVGSAGFLTIVVISLLLWRGHFETALLVLGIGLAIGTIIALFFTKRFLNRLPFAGWMGQRLPYRQHVSRVYEAFRHYRRHKMRLAFCLGLSLFVQVLLVLVSSFIGHSVGVRATPLEYLIRIPLIGAISTIPISVGSIGLAEFGYAYFFLDAGAPESYRSIVGAFALMMRLLWVFVGAVGGIIWWAEKGRLPAKALAETERIQSSEAEEEIYRRDRGERRG